MVKMLGAKPVIVRPKAERLSAADLQASISSKTRAFILNSPVNPSGVVYTKEELESFLSVIESKEIWLLSDDTYYELVYAPHTWTSCLKIRPNFRERTCVIGSSSKSYAMTGWRLGWASAPKPILKAMAKLQGQITSSPSAISQAAVQEAVGESHRFSAEFRERFQVRRNLLLELLAKIPGISWLEPQGAFYCFIRLDQKMPAEKVTAFCEKLLEEKGVCLVPGEAFGEPSYVRLSYALSEEQIREGLNRLEMALID